jgi:hypothetical protein
MEVSVKEFPQSFYQRRIEEFYNDLIDVFWRNRFGLYTDPCKDEPYIVKPDIELIVFEDILYGDPYDSEPMEKLLSHLAEKGWQIIMNFMAQDCLLGNVAVKIGDKWFAFGQCRKNEDNEPYVAEIWPLKYVLSRISKMELKPFYCIVFRPDTMEESMQKNNKG